MSCRADASPDADASTDADAGIPVPEHVALVGRADPRPRLALDTAGESGSDVPRRRRGEFPGPGDRAPRDQPVPMGHRVPVGGRRGRAGDVVHAEHRHGRDVRSRAAAESGQGHGPGGAGEEQRRRVARDPRLPHGAVLLVARHQHRAPSALGAQPRDVRRGSVPLRRDGRRVRTRAAGRRRQQHAVSARQRGLQALLGVCGACQF